MIDEKKRLNIREPIQFFQATKRKTEAQSKNLSNKPLRIQVKKQNKNLCIRSHGTLDREKPECLRKVLIVTLQLESCPNCQSRRVKNIFYARLFTVYVPFLKISPENLLQQQQKKKASEPKNNGT